MKWRVYVNLPIYTLLCQIVALLWLVTRVDTTFILKTLQSAITLQASKPSKHSKEKNKYRNVLINYFHSFLISISTYINRRKKKMKEQPFRTLARACTVFDPWLKWSPQKMLPKKRTNNLPCSLFGYIFWGDHFSQGSNIVAWGIEKRDPYIEALKDTSSA